MPWKETCVMDLRKEFIAKVINKEAPFSHLCRQYGISTKTGYKWKKRFDEAGEAGLRDESRRPHNAPNALSEGVVCTLIRIKNAHMAWGPPKIHDTYMRDHQDDGVCLTSVKRVLDKAGLVKHRRRRCHNACGRIQTNVDVKAPNQLWTVDFKGWWYSSEREKIEPLTVRDAYSRYILCVQAVPEGTYEIVREVFERLFEVYGLPEAVRSDNGPPFASMNSVWGLTRLSAWWVALGISLDRIDPGHPEQNGDHERMHLDIANELEDKVPGGTIEHQGAFEVWRDTFNNERPHEALGMKRPGEVYRKSERKYERGDFQIDYPLDYDKRLVGSRGAIRIENCRIAISTALSGWHVGLKKTQAFCYSVWLGSLYLGSIDLETQSFTAGR
jgi:transposase InsO family protein